MDKNIPNISIIVPAYNVDLYLKQCIESLINQTFKSIEIILLDDGSTDRTGIICDEFAKMDNRITVIHKTNSGLSDTRNVGIANSNGEFLMFIDADDWIDLDTCEIAYKAAKENNVDMVFWSYVREYKHKSQPKNFRLKEGIYNKEQLRESLHRMIAGLLGNELKYPENSNAIVTAWAKLYRTSIIKKRNIEFVNRKLISGEDILFNFYVFNDISRAVFINKCFNHYRKNNVDSLTSTYKKNVFEMWQVLHRMMNDFIIEKHLPQNFTEALNNRIALTIIGLGITELSQANKKTVFQKITYIGEILSDPQYRIAYTNLQLKYFPPHWWLFFFFCKKKFSTGVYLLLKILVFLRNKN